MKQWKIYGVGILLFVVVGFLFGFAKDKNSSRKIQTIKVNFKENPSTFISAEKVNKLLIQRDSRVLNKPKSLINLQELEEVVLSDEMVEKSEVFMTLDNELHIDVTQRVPIARVQDGLKSYYIDRQGTKMPLSANFSARVPLVVGVKTADELQEVYQLVNIINEDSFYKKMIIGYKLLDNDDYLLSTRLGQYKILLGKMDNAAAKLKKLKVFFAKKWDTQEMKYYKLINIKYDHQVVCSK